MLKFGDLRKKSKKRKTENQRDTQNKKEELIMTVGRVIATYGDDFVSILARAAERCGVRGLRLDSADDIFTELAKVKGRGSVTIDGKAFNDALPKIKWSAMGDSDANMGLYMFRKMIARCENPSITLAAKASEQGFNIARVSLNDGAKTVASAAASITTKSTHGIQPQVCKVRVNTASGLINMRGHEMNPSFSRTVDALEDAFKMPPQIAEDLTIRNSVSGQGGLWGAQINADLKEGADLMLPRPFGKLACKLFGKSLRNFGNS